MCVGDACVLCVRVRARSLSVCLLSSVHVVMWVVCVLSVVHACMCCVSMLCVCLCQCVCAVRLCGVCVLSLCVCVMCVCVVLLVFLSLCVLCLLPARGVWCVCLFSCSAGIPYFLHVCVCGVSRMCLFVWSFACEFVFWSTCLVSVYFSVLFCWLHVWFIFLVFCMRVFLWWEFLCGLLCF